MKTTNAIKKKLKKHYDEIALLLELLYESNDNDYDEEFRIPMSETDIIDYARKTVLSVLSNQITEKDISNIEILPDKELIIRVNAHFNLNEDYKLCREMKLIIACKIKIFTGYDVDIEL